MGDPTLCLHLYSHCALHLFKKSLFNFMASSMMLNNAFFSKGHSLQGLNRPFLTICV